MCDLFCVLTLAATTSCEQIRIDISSNGAPALLFSPNTTNSRPRDILDFCFIDETAVLSVLLGTVDSPCTISRASYFFNTPHILGDPTSSNVYSVNVTNNDEMIIYCGVAAHCRAVMVGIINHTLPTILDTYATAAKAVRITVALPMMAGGVHTKGTVGRPVGGSPPEAMGGAPPAGGGTSGANPPASPAPTAKPYKPSILRR